MAVAASKDWRNAQAHQEESLTDLSHDPQLHRTQFPASSIVVGNRIGANLAATHITQWAAERRIDSELHVLICHQPNMLAYRKLLGQFEFAAAIAKHLRNDGFRVRLTFLANDYDSWSDPNFRRAPMPTNDQGRLSYVHLKPAARCSTKTIIAHLGEIPARYDSYLRRQILGSIAATMGGLPRHHKIALRDAAEDIVAEVVDLLNNASTWPQFCIDYIAFAAAG